MLIFTSGLRLLGLNKISIYSHRSRKLIHLSILTSILRLPFFSFLFHNAMWRYSQQTEINTWKNAWIIITQEVKTFLKILSSSNMSLFRGISFGSLLQFERTILPICEISNNSSLPNTYLWDSKIVWDFCSKSIGHLLSVMTIFNSFP